MRGATCQQLLVVIRAAKRSGDFLALLDEAGRMVRPIAAGRPIVMELNHGTIHMSGISQR